MASTGWSCCFRDARRFGKSCCFRPCGPESGGLRPQTRFIEVGAGGTGDGALCEFASPGAAIECAAKLCASASELGIEIRAGVHTGECERRGDDLAGMAVHVGARVCGAAGPSEVLVSRTVRDLVTGSGLGFVSRGEQQLKGVPDTWELFAAGREAEARMPAPAAPQPRASDKLVMEVSRRAPVRSEW